MNDKLLYAGLIIAASIAFGNKFYQNHQEEKRKIEDEALYEETHSDWIYEGTACHPDGCYEQMKTVYIRMSERRCEKKRELDPWAKCYPLYKIPKDAIYY